MAQNAIISLKITYFTKHRDPANRYFQGVFKINAKLEGKCQKMGKKIKQN